MGILVKQGRAQGTLAGTPWDKWMCVERPTVQRIDSSKKRSCADLVDLQLPESLKSGLAGLSARTGRDASDLVIEAVDRMLAQERWFEERVQLGIDQIARGEFLEEEQMDARMARMIRA